MKKFFKLLSWIAIIAGAVLLVKFFFFQKEKIVSQTQKETSAQPQTAESPAPNTTISEANPPKEPDSSSASDSTSPKNLPAKFLLDIPFYSQAPLGNWDKVHEEMCEEASVLNAGLYLLDKKISKDDFEKELFQIKKIEEKLLHDYKSTTITQTKQFTDQYFNGKVQTKILDNPSFEDIEREIAAGHPVIAPLSGRDIGNPNFTPPGPIYHMLVIKGFDENNFITNDVGTRKGDSYIYKKEVIMKNIHDWNEQDIHLGAKKILVLYK